MSCNVDFQGILFSGVDVVVFNLNLFVVCFYLGRYLILIGLDELFRIVRCIGANNGGCKVVGERG